MDNGFHEIVQENKGDFSGNEWMLLVDADQPLGQHCYLSHRQMDHGLSSDAKHEDKA